MLEGEIHVDLDGEERTVTAGETIDVPPGTTHQMWCDVPSRQRWTTTPALKTERFFETMWGLQQDGKTGGPTPSLPQTALTLRRFSDEFRLANPPGPLQDLLMMPLAALGKLAGHGRRVQTGDVTMTTAVAYPPQPSMPPALQMANWIFRPIRFLDDCRDKFGTPSPSSSPASRRRW